MDIHTHKHTKSFHPITALQSKISGFLGAKEETCRQDFTSPSRLYPVRTLLRGGKSQSQDQTKLSLGSVKLVEPGTLLMFS